jgi:hypothetical protein
MRLADFNEFLQASFGSSRISPGPNPHAKHYEIFKISQIQHGSHYPLKHKDRQRLEKMDDQEEDLPLTKEEKEIIERMVNAYSKRKILAKLQEWREGAWCFRHQLLLSR